MIPSLEVGLHDAPSLDRIRQLARPGAIKMLGEITTQYEGVSPDDSRLESYWALAEELDLSVGIHMGPGPPGAAYLGAPGYRMSLGDPLLLEPVTLHADPREITIGEQLQGGSGMRSEPIYRHRFASAEMRDRFGRWLQASDNLHVLEGLVQLAYSEGTKALSLELDRLAAAPVAAAKRRKGRTLTAA
ncbi:hypothetical protein [Sphingomonas adhaesiva]|uniref:hypothetical protein n=1 Tax=Sphingomonas adhaesiva TaxID=28212 RepID=UPI002FF5A0D2